MKIGIPSSKIFSDGLLRQLTALALITTTFILLFFGWHRIQSQTEELTYSLHTAVEANSQWLATALEQPLYNFDYATVSALCKSLLTLPDIVQITVNANKETLVFSSIDSQFIRQSPGDSLSVSKSILFKGRKIGEVQILASLKLLKKQIKKTTAEYFFQIFILDIFLVATIIFFLSRKFIIPVDQLQEAAEKIAGGDLEHVIDIQSSNELGQLADNLETMRKTLQTKISDMEVEVAIRRSTEKELKLAKNYIDNIINSMPSLLIGVDSQHRVTQWNRQAEKVSGISSASAKGLDIIEILPRFAREKDKISRAIASKQVLRESGYAAENSKDTRYEDITIFPLVSDGVNGAVIRIDDVTEQHQMRVELSHSRRLEAIGQLAGGVAHDFNNMLGGILGGAELLALHVGDDKKAKQYIKMIISSAQRASDLTNKLLAFARKGKVESSPINVANVIHEAVAILEHSIDKRINIVVSIKPKSTLVVGDMTQLQSTLINLGLNAGHSMPDGGDLYIMVDLVYLDEAYCTASPFDIQVGWYFDIEVRDTGTGIPAENIHQIFEPFYTTRKQGKGSGLGLAAVYGTVQQHHGAITVHSELGTGTTFHIFLPMAEQQIGTTFVGVESPVSGSGKILVVDDEQVIRSSAKAILENLGYEVLLAVNGQHGLNIFQKEFASIDLVVMDMIMPKMNGRECFFAMKKIHRNVKVVLASGFSRDTDLEELKKEGLWGFLRKPYTTAELSSVIVAALK